MSHRVAWVRAQEILDSRGRPTLAVHLGLEGGATGWADVPSGASTGSREAFELRDGDDARYAGAGVGRAVACVEGEIATALVARAWGSLADIDHALIGLDGTADKSRLGANAIVGTSMAASRALAAAGRLPLYRFLAPEGTAARLPVPHFNVINGGAHAQNRLDFQEFMLAPFGAPSFSEALRAGAETYSALRRLLHDAGHATGLGDEGGFAPELARPEDALDLLVAAIEAAGYRPGSDGIAIALDPAASGFRAPDGSYGVAGESLSSSQLVELYAALVARYPIWSIEDGLAEDDEAGWIDLTAALGDRVQVVGDDLLVTDPRRIAAGVEARWATAALIKVNQVGTVSETLEAMAACRRGGWAQMVSHRSGETTDPYIADLAVAAGCGQIKAGAPGRGERVAKYNRLIEIEAELPRAPYGVVAAAPAEHRT
jgi:enolase